MTRWTRKEDQEIVRLWNEGYSAHDIGWMIGRDSKNAVIGRLDRLRKRYGAHLKLIQHGRFTGKAKLTPAQISEISESKETLAVLAARFGVGINAISKHRSKIHSA